jgi:hypothetical protein
MEVPHNLKIELAYDPAIALLGIYPREPKSAYYRGTHISTFILALFTISNPPTDEWIHTHNGVLLKP